MRYTEKDFNEGMEKAAFEAYEYRMAQIGQEAPAPEPAQMTKEAGAVDWIKEKLKVTKLPPEIAKLPPAEQARWYKANVMDKEKTGAELGKEAAAFVDQFEKIAQPSGASPYGVAPGPFARGPGGGAGRGLQPRGMRQMPPEPEPSFAVKHPTAVTAGAGAAGGLAGGAAGFGAGKLIESVTGSSQAGIIGAGVGGTIGSILGAALGSREGEKAEEGYSRQLVDYLSKMSAEKTAAKKGEKVEATWAMKHPVGAGGAMFGGRTIGKILQRAASEARSSKLQAAALPIWVAHQGLSRGISGRASWETAKKWQEATGKPLSEAPSWFMRHPFAGGMLLPSVGLGMTASKTRKALEAKKLLKKTSADKSGKSPKSYQMYYGPTPESVKRLQKHETRGAQAGTLAGILAGLGVAGKAISKPRKSLLANLAMLGAPAIGGVGGRKGGRWLGKEIGEMRTGAKTETLPFISPRRTLAMARIAGKKSTVPRELPASSKFIKQPTVSVKAR